jgi:hypothetical protein
VQSSAITRRSWFTRTNCCSSLTSGMKSFGLVWMLVASTACGWAQTRLGAESRLRSFDLAVLESGEPRADFSCEVTPYKADLGFDLRFHADYRVTVPVKVLADAGGWLQVVMRVTPAANPEAPTYFVQRITVPHVPSKAKGEGQVTGGFELGYGRYQVDWMMRDASKRVCSSHWKLEAKPARRLRNVPLTLARGMIAERGDSSSDDKLPVDRATQPLRVKILLNLSPARPQQSILKPEDAAVLLSMLRGITREPGVNRFSLVAFNIWEQKIIARQDKAETIDFGALAQAIDSPTNGTVNYRRLQDPKGDVHFVTKLLMDQLGTRAASPDAILIVGPKVTLQKKLPLESLKEGGTAPCPIFYLNYNPNPIDDPWPDTIGSALKAYTGASAYNIVFPRDLGAAMRDILSRIGKVRTVF